MDHEQMAAELSEALGRKIVFDDVSLDEYCESAEKIGIPPFGINFFRGALVDYRNGRMSGADNNIEELTGRRAMTVGEFARAHADQLNAK
jgi:NAD(P)H dehydrogenase (quinone)